MNIDDWMKTHTLTKASANMKHILKSEIDLIRRVEDRNKLLQHLKANGWLPNKVRGELYSYMKRIDSDDQQQRQQQISDTDTVQPVIKKQSTSFNIANYSNPYKKQLSFTLDNDSCNLSVCFNSALAVYTNTVLYKDLPLSLITEFEKDIDWESVRSHQSPEDSIEYSNPFITHLNPVTRTFITAFNGEPNRDPTYGLLLMSNIAKQHNYNYLVAMSCDQPKIKRTCEMLGLPAKNIIILDEEILSTIADEIKSTTNETIVDSTIVLRDYQLEYIEYMNNHKHGIFKLPCGMGKSLIMIYHMMTHKQNTIILVPNIALVDQFNNNIKRVYTNFKQELPEIHRLSTKDKEFEVKNNTNQQIIISVYNSFVKYFVEPRINDSMNVTTITSITDYSMFPYIYIDEAHHVIMPSNKLVHATMKTLLESFNALELNSQPKKAEIELVDVLNSNKNLKTAFASLLYVYANKYCQHDYYFSATIEPANYSKYNMFSAIQDGYLCRLNIEFIIDDTFNILNNIESTVIDCKAAKKIADQHKLENFISYINKTDYKSIIVYTSRVKTAKLIAERLNSAAVITASLPAAARQKYFDDFVNHRLRTLLTVNCISEGVDLPNADTAIFYNDKHSIVNIIQCVGRVMRTCDDKVSATLAIPAYCDEDLELLYKNILSVINGELGYGNADIRRIVSLVFNNVKVNIDSPDIKRIKQHVLRAVYNYNENYFNEICVYNKLNLCKSLYNFNREIPSVDSIIDKPETNEKNNKNANVKAMVYQFVKDNLWLDNFAGKELRTIYGIKQE